MDEFGLGPILASLDKVINFAAVTVDSAPESKERELLEKVATHLRRLRTDMPEMLPQALGKLKTTAEKARDDAARLQGELDAASAKLDTVKQQVEAAKSQARDRLAAGPPAPPEVPLPPIDLELGTKLRAELLARYVPQADGSAKLGAGKDIWEDWK